MSRILKKDGRNEEERDIEVLEKINGAAKDLYRDVKKKIHYENRILNKDPMADYNPYNNKIKTMKMNREFKKIAIETMFLVKNPIDEGNDDNIKKDMIDEYTNVDNLKWQIRKNYILKKNKPKHIPVKKSKYN